MCYNIIMTESVPGNMESPWYEGMNLQGLDHKELEGAWDQMPGPDRGKIYIDAVGAGKDDKETDMARHRAMGRGLLGVRTLCTTENFQAFINGLVEYAKK